MNRAIAKTGSAIVLATVILFAAFMLLSFDMGSYFEQIKSALPEPGCFVR